MTPLNHQATLYSVIGVQSCQPPGSTSQTPKQPEIFWEQEELPTHAFEKLNLLCFHHVKSLCPHRERQHRKDLGDFLIQKTKAQKGSIHSAPLGYLSAPFLSVQTQGKAQILVYCVWI